MEIPRSLSKRSFSSGSNGGYVPAYNAVYDDVFGTLPDSRNPIMTPRFEEYSEIFGGFNAARSSSIPVLHIPHVGRGSRLRFDVRSPDFDYAEVFGRVGGGSAVTTSFQDVLGRSSGGSCFSRELRSPLQTEFMSNESDPLSGSFSSDNFSEVDAHQPSGSTKQLNASRSKHTRRNAKAKAVSTKNAHVSTSSNGPGHGFSFHDIAITSNEEAQACSITMEDEVKLENHLQETLHGSGSQRAPKPVDKSEFSSSMLDKPFISISDISLQTKPSKLPPPSRPPPVAAPRKGECDKSLENFAVGMAADENIFLDVEVDETCHQKGDKSVRVVPANNVDARERDFFGCSSMQYDEEQTDPAGVGSFEEEILHSCGKAAAVSIPVPEDLITSRKDAHETSKVGVVDMVDNNISSDDSTKSVTWKELAEYFRANEKKKHGLAVTAEDSAASGCRNTCLYQKENEIHKKETKVTMDGPSYGNETNQPAAAKAKFSCGSNLPKNGNELQNEMRKEHYNKDNLGEMISGNSQQLYGENEKVKILPCATVEGLSAAVDNVDFREAKIVRFAFPTEFETEEKFLDVPIWELNSLKANTNFSNGESQRLPKDAGHVKPGKGVGKFNKLQGIEKSHSVVSVNETKKEQLQGVKIKENGFILRDNLQGQSINKANERCGAAQRPLGTDAKAGFDYVGEGKVNDFMNRDLHEQFGIEILQRTGHGEEANCSSAGMAPGEVSVNLHDSSYKLEANPTTDIGGQGNTKATSASGGSGDSKREPNSTIGSHSFPKRGIEDPNVMKHKIHSTADSNIEHENIFKSEDGKNKGMTQPASRKIGIKGAMKESLANSDATICSMKTSTSQSNERKDKSVIRNTSLKGHDTVTGESVIENDDRRKIEEEKEREREREKDRMAVDKAALEVKPSAEAAGGRVGLQISSIEARLRAERAAVERATTEARQRAAEKLMSHNSEFGSSSMPSSLHSTNAGVWKNFQHSSSSSSLHDGADVELPQRCKARLERYQRTADCVANALAEKNKQDLIAQIEIEERKKIAEAFDAEFKRWSSGKEGNLRALLSTLQYILGHESGWQPIPLTEIVTCAAVKRAYKKATLCVHPDKLQQRGATVQHKYICEKVFDLLKEAWNKFNSQEC